MTTLTARRPQASKRLREQRRLNVALGQAMRTEADLWDLYLGADSQAARLRIAAEIRGTEAVIRRNVTGAHS